MATAKKAQKLETIKVVVSKAHYDAATKASQTNSYFMLTQCLVAQAVKPVFKGKISVGSDDVEVGTGGGKTPFVAKRQFSIDKRGQNLIAKFDNNEVDRKKLPITIKLTEVPLSRWSSSPDPLGPA